jgi:maleylacetoacetate isomerase
MSTAPVETLEPFYRKDTVMTTTHHYELYAFWRTSATYRVRVALNLKGLIAKEHDINLDKGENRSESFLATNPMGAIPALVVNGSEPITQSQAVLEFLEEAHPETPLLPKDLHGRARVRSLAAMLVADTHPLVTGRIKKYLVGGGQMDDAAFRNWQINWFTTGLQAFEKRLATDTATGTYCHGNNITMADICLASIIVVMRVFKIEVVDIPHITRIMTLLDANEAFAKAAPLNQSGAPKS